MLLCNKKQINPLALIVIKWYNVHMLNPKGLTLLSKIINTIQSKFYLRLILAYLAGVIMFAFVALTSGNLAECPLWLGFYGSLLCFAYILPIIAERDIPLAYMAVSAVAVAALAYVRISMFYYQSGDYGSFLYHWVEQMRGMSLTEAMKADIGDYNMPYLYILFAISRAKINDLYLIKLVSCLFDGLAAFFVMKIVGHFRKGAVARIVAFVATLALPTVWLNGAFWGQCDVVFASLCLGMVWAILKGKGNLATILWALAFAFKLQAIFALPLLIIALFTKRIKPLSLVWIVPVFFATLVPALLCGRAFGDCIKIYFEQADQYPQMHLNIPSIWTLLGHVSFDNFNAAAIFLAGSALVVFLLLCYHWREAIDDKKLMTLFFIGALLIPFLLPRMHDRYYFLADVAALALFLIDFKRWYVPLVTVLSSYAGYRYFVMGGEVLFDHKYFAIAILVMLTIMIKDTFKEMAEKSSQPTLLKG